jgi:hypothetical protein
MVMLSECLFCPTGSFSYFVSSQSIMIEYYKILGVSSNATLLQIKKAYRMRAKMLHPDVNKQEDAKDQFILLNEAYEYLVKLLNSTGHNRFNTKAKDNNLADFQREWKQYEREKARARAQEYARMKYEAYINSEVYRTTVVVDSIVNTFGILVLLVVTAVFPLLTCLKYGQSGFLIAFLIVLPFVPVWLRIMVAIFSKRTRGNQREWESHLRSKVIWMFIISVVNLVVFFSFALSTIITLKCLLVIYGGAIALALVLSKGFSSRYVRYLVGICIAPLLVNFFFLINFTFSSHSVVESYWYTYDSISFTRTFKTITLEDDVYADYPGIRFFVNYEEVVNKSRIRYTIEEGCFGLKVIKKREVFKTNE